jgi:hypothetical protein
MAHISLSLGDYGRRIEASMGWTALTDILRAAATSNIDASQIGT